MSDPLHTFLQTIGAALGPGVDCICADEPAALDTFETHNVIVPLSHCGVLEVHGPEAETFLQGQITCSAAETSPALSTPGAYCTVKGRVVANFQLLRPEDERFWLRLRRDTVDIAARTLGKYIVFSKAKLAPAAEIIGIGLRGPAVAALLEQAAGALPTQQHGTVSHGGGLLLQGDAAGTQFEYWGPAAAATELWAHCAPGCTAVGSRYWRWLRIRAGDADIGAATSESFLPHMLNYHVTGAINFKKGCYTGQEIIARTHYRGQVKRHLLRAALTGDAPAPGSEITDESGKNVGNVVDSVAVSASAAELLAVVADSESAAGASADTPTVLRAGSAGLQALALPYAIP